MLKLGALSFSSIHFKDLQAEMPTPTDLSWIAEPGTHGLSTKRDPPSTGASKKGRHRHLTRHFWNQILEASLQQEECFPAKLLADPILFQRP